MRQTTLSFLRLVLATAAIGFAVPLAAQSPAPSAPAQPVAQNVAAAPAGTAAPADDIRDIRGPKTIASPVFWIFWIAGALALAAILYGSYCWYRHARSRAKLPYEIALERLEKARALMKLDTAREFSIEVSEIVRSYIEARFQVRAAHQTTEEFLHQLLEPSDALLARHQELLADFLHHCDLAKFARWILSSEEMEQMHASARTFVLETGKVSPEEAKPQQVAETANA